MRAALDLYPPDGDLEDPLELRCVAFLDGYLQLVRDVGEVIVRGSVGYLGETALQIGLLVFENGDLGLQNADVLAFEEAATHRTDARTLPCAVMENLALSARRRRH